MNYMVLTYRQEELLGRIQEHTDIFFEIPLCAFGEVKVNRTLEHEQCQDDRPHLKCPAEHDALKSGESR